ncbi:uncharacterized protein MYCGRDRAFT_90710 [Zymoseptoria tritici IPO323]|uniref:Uncharacterized protein n=1 Tax=Zymoseptoria tritici (strain CBS 115943 / IPO323) TaxID=336722 RepID=F9X2B8_ZYMTI|nr:uncharacterized protein MYCGRDRAFT_90710 [Zymoseptoria tritici IPO323]EGP89893.1 hypothetical protein MYCGRDRAFT_90710 [Zymoseptoria tritici IPO323]
MASGSAYLQPYYSRLEEETSVIEESLANITTAILHAHTSKDPQGYDVIRAHCHIGLQVHHALLEPIPSTTNLEAHLAVVNDIRAASSGLNVKSYNYSPLVSEDKRRAVVWFTTPGSGLPGDFLTNQGRRKSPRTNHKGQSVTSLPRLEPLESLSQGSAVAGSDKIPLVVVQPDNPSAEVGSHGRLQDRMRATPKKRMRTSV